MSTVLCPEFTAHWPAKGRPTMPQQLAPTATVDCRQSVASPLFLCRDGSIAERPHAAHHRVAGDAAIENLFANLNLPRWCHRGVLIIKTH